MKSGLSFLITALQCEIDELDQLAATCEAVGSIGRLVHALQRERGLSNVMLASAGQRFAAQRLAQVVETQRLELDVRAAFDALAEEPRRVGNGTRLFSRIAAVVPGLDALKGLRQQVGTLQLDALQATAAYARLIAGLLGVVFEAADGATDPQISRQLAALFNFMQGKEFAGQERAVGAAAFAAGRMDATRRSQWLALIAAQERCFAFFADFSGPALAQAWEERQPMAERAELERMRRIGCATDDAALDAQVVVTWFDTCSLRIDGMQQIEERLTQELQALCLRRIADARTLADQHRALFARLPEAASERGALSYFDACPPADTAAPVPVPFSHQLERSTLEMLQEQTRRMQVLNDELESVRAALNDRKLVERAKGLLMARRHLSEEEAHRMLRQTAMKQNRRLVDVAESVLQMADYLSEGS